MTNVTLGLTGLEAGDSVLVSGFGGFSQADVGSGLDYAIIGINLGGADAGNYYLSGGSTLSGNNGEITPAALTVSGIAANNKTYDGTTAATVDAAGAVLGGLVGGDVVTVSASGVFGDKNVGSGKTVTLTSNYGGADLGNYTIIDQASTTADILRLGSVTWTGAASGNWFDPANWAGGAVPDLSNVANVVIPAGVNVIFDTSGAVSPAETGAVGIDSLGTSGGLTQHNGELNIGTGGLMLSNFVQTGGTLASLGDFVVDGEFSQVDGTVIAVDGLATITAFGQPIELLANNVFAGGFSNDALSTVVIPPSTPSQPIPKPGDAPPELQLSADNTASGEYLVQTGTQSATIEGSTDQILVILVQDATQADNGLINVLVPKNIIANGFSFELPEKPQAKATSAAGIKVTALDGGPLPAWLQYDLDRRLFKVSAIPEGILPYTVVVEINGLRSLVVISKSEK